MEGVDGAFCFDITSDGGAANVACGAADAVDEVVGSGTVSVGGSAFALTTGVAADGVDGAPGSGTRMGEGQDVGEMKGKEAQERAREGGNTFF